MAVCLQPGAMNDAAGKSYGDACCGEVAMKIWSGEDTAWAVAQMQERVSVRGWLFAMLAGIWLWSVVVALLLRL